MPCFAFGLDHPSRVPKDVGQRQYRVIVARVELARASQWVECFIDLSQCDSCEPQHAPAKCMMRVALREILCDLRGFRCAAIVEERHHSLLFGRRGGGTSRSGEQFVGSLEGAARGIGAPLLQQRAAQRLPPVRVLRQHERHLPGDSFRLLVLSQLPQRRQCRDELVSERCDLRGGQGA